ncbi:MAG TPA: hypothetical protein VMU38_09610 [Candidatus Binatia bacterium]|nr:hypothetical protein [Candidatus Binatia bacterium]
MLLTRELFATLRHAQHAELRAMAEAAQRLLPDIGVETIDVAGGLAVFAGIERPISKAYGVGSFAAVSAGDVARITEFYESRGTTPRVTVDPLADATLGRTLAQSGYTPCDFTSVMATDELQAAAFKDERIGIAADVRAWAIASAQGFRGRETLEPGDDEIATIVADTHGVVALEGRDGDAIAATSAMGLSGECASIIAGSTLVAYRNRGWHLAMIRDRLARAVESGARIAHGFAGPGGRSERNFHRCGFQTLYTRVLWEKRTTTQ